MLGRNQLLLQRMIHNVGVKKSNLLLIQHVLQLTSSMTLA